MAPSHKYSPVMTLPGSGRNQASLGKHPECLGPVVCASSRTAEPQCPFVFCPQLGPGVGVGGAGGQACVPPGGPQPATPTPAVI